MNQQPFGPNFSKTKSISVTNSSGSATLDASDYSTSSSPNTGFNVMRIANTGSVVAFVRWGIGAQTALTTDLPVLPGTVELFTKPLDVNTVAAITASGTTTLYITCGEGT